VLAGATPATPGEVIAVYGTGFGPTTPAVDGLVLSFACNLAALPPSRLEAHPAAVTFAGGARGPRPKSTSRFPPSRRIDGHCGSSYPATAGKRQALPRIVDQRTAGEL